MRINDAGYICSQESGKRHILKLNHGCPNPKPSGDRQNDQEIALKKIEVTFDWMALSEILFRMKSNLQKTDNQNDLVPRFRSKSLYRRTSKIEVK